MAKLMLQHDCFLQLEKIGMRLYRFSLLVEFYLGDKWNCLGTGVDSFSTILHPLDAHQWILYLYKNET